MCTAVDYDGRLIETMPVARRLLGEANIIIHGGYSIDSFTGDSCCCPVDWEATAKRLGRKLNDDDSVVWKLESPAQEETP